MINQSTKTNHHRVVLKYAGAFIAWVIGAGFATGQEVLRFFASFGYWSYAIVLLNLAGFLFLGRVLLDTGFRHKAEKPFNQFKFYCGARLGAFYSWLIPFTLLLIIPVLISGAGATLSEYYGVHPVIGWAAMTVLVLGAYLVGFERLVKIVAPIGPVIIFFSLLVGTITILRDFNHFSEIPNFQAVLSTKQSSPHWLLSSFLYLSLTFFGGSTYFNQLGVSAANRKAAMSGATLGAVAPILSIAIMNTAILLNAGSTARLAIPVLFLAKKIAYLLGAVFSIVLIMGMFSACSAMLWSVCSRFSWGGRRGNRIFALFIAALTFVLSLFSFSELLGVLYPLVGYIGLPYIGCVICKGIRTKAYAFSSTEEQAKSGN